MFPIRCGDATSRDDHTVCVFRQKLFYRIVLPGILLACLCGAVATTVLALRGEHSGNLTGAAVYLWLMVLFLVRPARDVFASVVLDSESLKYRNLFGSYPFSYQDATGIRIDRSRPSITLRSKTADVYFGNTYERIDDLIDLLEAAVQPHLLGRDATETDVSERESTILLPRTFPRTIRSRMQTYLGIVACVCPAIFLSNYVANSPAPVLLIAAAVFWLLSCLALRNLLFSPLSLSVDADGLSCKRLYGEVRIPFGDAVELKVSERRDKTVMRLRSRTRSIVCDNDYENWTDLMRLVENCTPEYILKSPISREFRYPGALRFLFAACVLLFAGAVVGASWSGFLYDHSDDFKSEVLFPALGFAAFALVSLYAFLEVSEKVYFERDRIVSVSWRGRREIFFDAEIAVEKVRPWHGDERLVVSSSRKRISISHQLVGYEDLIHDLKEIVPVKWRREEAVSFPLEVRLNLWWAPLAFYSSFGGALAVYFTHQWVDMLRSGEGGSGVQCLVGGGFGAFMLWLGLRHVLTCPKSAAFDEYGFTVRLGFGTRHYTSEQVESIVYREDRRKGNVFGRIAIRVAGREYLLAEPGATVPLVPVYELICKEYWPEGYREPEPVILKRGETGE